MSLANSLLYTTSLPVYLIKLYGVVAKLRRPADRAWFFYRNVRPILLFKPFSKIRISVES